MAIRTQLLSGSYLAKAKDGVHSEPGNIEGCALEIKKRDGGKSMRAYFRYNGTPFNERRTMRIPLGPYEQGLNELRRKRGAYEELIRKNRSPNRYKQEAEDQLRAAGMTLREAMDEFWKFGQERLWNPKSLRHNNRVRKKHLESLPLMDMPIESIRAVHIADNIGHKWRTTSGIGPRMRSLVHSTLQYQIDKDDGVYRGPNPVSWRKKSPASQKLGPQKPSRPSPSVYCEDIPKVFAYFCRPMDHWVPGYLTTMQAADALEIDPKSIRSHHAYGHYKGVLAAPKIFKSASNLIPISELKRVHGEFKHDPKPHEQESARVNARLMRFLILCPVRAANATELRWRNIRPEVEGGIIEYLPKRQNLMTGEWLDSEHKNGWKYNVVYIIPLTENLRAIIEEQRQENIREGLKTGPDDYVFLHGRCATGINRWYGDPSSHRTLKDYIGNAITRLTAQGETIRLVPEGAKRATIHGLRGGTFTTWAKKHGYNDDMINLTLGHIIPAIAENKTNWSYFWGVQLIPERRKMMEHWERNCFSLVEPLTNVIELSNVRR